MRVNGRMTFLMVWESFFIPMAIIMMGSFLMETKVEKGSIFIVMVIFMMEDGKRIKSGAMVYLDMPMETSIVGFGLMTK